MDINKVIFRGIKIAFPVMIALLVVYGTMRASFAAYDYGYRLAVESLKSDTGETENTQNTQNTESTESTGE